MQELNKYILHYLLHNGILKCNQAPEIINKIAAKLNTPANDLKQIIPEINNNISKHLFRIDVRTCEITGEKVCVFINKSIDDLSTSFTHLPAVELELIESIFHELLLSDSKSISSILCLNLTSKLRGNISKDNAQLMLDACYKNGYLVNYDGLVYLGPRAISEFEQYFKIKFANRMTACKLCTDFVYFGNICGTCNEVFHKHCVSKHLSRTNSCPICKKTWVEAQERNYDDSEADSDNDVSMDSD